MKRKMLPIIALIIILLSVIIGASACSEEEVPVERIALTSLPKLEYLKGEPFDVNDAQLAIYYANGRRETMPLSFEMVSDYDPQEIGEHVLTITHEKIFTNIKIRISNAPITYIEPVEGQLPYQTEYIEDQDLDLSNLYLKINYQSGDPDIIPVTEDMVSGYDRNIIGEQQVIITYLDEHTTNYTVEVRQKQISSISQNHPPNKELYLVNEKIEIADLAGGELFISYDNGYTEYIVYEDLFENQAELDEALEYDTSRVGKNVARLHYGGKSVIFEITVLIKAAEIIEIISLPSEIQVVGTSLSLEGGELFITYNNATEQTVYMTDEKVSYTGYDKNTVGLQQITLSFSDIDDTIEIPIQVVDATPVELEILPPVLNEENEVVPSSEVTQTPKIEASFYQEGVIDLGLWEYRLKMDNDTYSDVYPVSESMLEGDLSQLELEDYGMRTLTFSYIREEAQLECNVEISVIQKLLDSISVTPPENTIFYRGEPLVLTGADFTAYYNDGTVYSDDITIDMVSGYNNLQLGEQDVAVTYSTDKYGSKVDTFRVLVIRKAIYIEFVSALKTEYIIGEEFSLDGLVMRIHYEGFGQPENFGGPFGEEWSFHNTQFDELGEHEVTVQYQAVGLSLDTVIPITVRNEITAIELVKFEDDTYVPQTEFPEVVAGMDINLDGYYLKLTLENGVDYTPVTKTMLDYQREDRTLDDRDVLVSYQGFSINASVNVINKEISNLVLTSIPIKEYYKANLEQVLDIEGLAMRLYFTNQTSVQLNENTFFEHNTETVNNTLEYRYLNQEGQEESIVLTITELDTTLQAGINYESRVIEISIEDYLVSFEIIVADKIATDITWDTSNPGEEAVDQPEIIAYQGIDEIEFPVGAAFKVIFNDGELSEIIDVNNNIEDITILEYNPNIAGIQNIYLRYQDILLSAIITVKAKDLLSIDFADNFPDPLYVIEGMPLDLRQSMIEVVYYHDMGEEEDKILDPAIVSLSTSMINYDKNDTSLGARPVIITFSYTGRETVTKTLLFNVIVEQKQLLDIKMGTIPKTKYIELDPYEYHGGTVILYYNNDTTTTLNLSDAKRVVSSVEIMPTDTFIVNYGQFDNSDFSGFSRKQQIFITYIEGSVTVKTSYDIIMHDRMYIQVRFEESEYFNEEEDTYYFWYGEDREIGYEIWGYTEHSDQLDESDMTKLEMQVGINYTFKYINTETGEEFGSWPRDAGSYEIYMSYDADSAVNNDRIHNSFEVNNRQLVIRPKSIHIVPDSMSKVYGEITPEYTSEIYAVEYNEQTDETNYHLINVFGYDETREVLGEITYLFFNSSGTQIEIDRKTSIGIYTVTASIEPIRNYFVTIDEGEFEITKREIVVMANSHEKEYGQVDPTFTYTTAAVMGNPQSGLIEGDSFDGFLLRYNPSSNNNVGEYNILFAPPSNLNYEVTYVGNTLSIYKRNLYLTIDDYTKIYGQQFPEFTIVPSSDYEQVFAYSDSMSSLLGELSFACMDNGTAIDISAGVGVYDIVAEGLSSYNYDIIYEYGELTIEKRQVEVQADNNQKVYGEQQDPPLTFSVYALDGVQNSGLYGEDELAGDLIREPGEDVGEYTIFQGEVNNINNPNYDISFVQATFTITKRDAQIEVLISSREYDGSIPYILDEEYVVHNAHGDIKENIDIIFGSYASSNIGSYRIDFESSDLNHNISFLNPDGYWLEITRRQVRTEFYNIPYGRLIEGEYEGSVYKGSPYYYEARIRESDIVEGDSVDITIQTAEGENPQDYSFENLDNVTDVGLYTVRVFRLSNNNYELVAPSPEEIEEYGDYRYTSFEIVPAEIEVLITIENMSKTYTGSEISFHNILTEVEGYYQTNDYVLLTELDFFPQGLNIYPYYINPQGQERLPRIVKYSMTDGEYDIVEGEYVIEGYDIKAVTGNDNYTVVIVDESGQPLERNEDGEIIDEEYRFKIMPQPIDVILWQSSVTKTYDGQAPSIGLNDYGLTSTQVDRQTEVFFDFVRKDYPEFMEGYIEDKDSGLFEIIPYTTNMNYKLQLESEYDYEIKAKTLGAWKPGELKKRYDNLAPTINNNQLVFDYYDGNYVLEERQNLYYELDFGGVESFDVGDYQFTLKFKFPTEEMDHSADEIYKYYMDFNHKFEDINTLNRVFTIQPRQTKIILLEGEGYNWKYYNGLTGSQLAGGENLFPNAFRIVDARYEETGMSEQVEDRTFDNGDPVQVMHLVNEQESILLVDLIQSVLELNFPSVLNAGTTSLISADDIINENPNLEIEIEYPESFIFRIFKQEVYYYFDNITRVYGESLAIEDYEFAMTQENQEKVAEAGVVDDWFVSGGLVDPQDLNIRAVDDSNLGEEVTYSTDVGFYRIVGDDLEISNYIFRYDSEMSRDKLEIQRRELPVEYVNDHDTYFTVTRIYGDDFENIIFDYVFDTGVWGKGLLIDDIEIINQASFELPQFSLIDGVGNVHTDVGIIEQDALDMSFNMGNNLNYYFTYDAFGGQDPKLEIIKADLEIQVLNNLGLSYLEATYGDPPSSADYYFELIGLYDDDTMGNVEFEEFSIYLEATTMDVGGQQVYFPSAEYTYTPAETRYLVDLLTVNLDLFVKYDYETMQIISHTIQPIIGLRNVTISRQATDGSYYPFQVDFLPAQMQNYNFLPQDTEYMVNPRSIDIYLELLSDGTTAENAEFNLLYGEEPYLITDEMVLLQDLGKEGVLLQAVEIGKLNKLNIAFAGMGVENTILLLRTKREILYQTNLISQYEYENLSQQQIDDIYDDEVNEQFLLNNLGAFDLTEQDVNDAYAAMTPSEIESAYDELATSQVIASVYNYQEYTKQELELIYTPIINNLDPDEQRMVFRFRYDESQLVYNDSIGEGSGYAIDVSDLYIVYDDSVGENKTIKAAGAQGFKYDYNYVESDLNIYNYVTSLGEDDELPNIMLKTQTDEFVIKVNYANGDIEYLSFNNPNTPTYDNITYQRAFEYVSSPINQLFIDSNQTITIKYTEILFGYKELTTVSQPFEVRMFEEQDELYWSRGKSLPNDYTGGTFISSVDTRDIGEEIDQNYTYYVSEFDGIDVVKAEYNFDYINTAFRLSPKAGMTNYYFDIILNGGNGGNDYMKLRLSGGQMQTVTLITNYNNEEIPSTQNKPGELDFFDGRTHEITAYIDKLGTRQSDPSGYKVIVIIDNSYYFSFSLGKGEDYQPYDNSLAGFLAYDTYAWVSKFDIYKQGLTSSRALKVMPTSDDYYSHHYAINDGSGMLALSYDDMFELVEGFTFPNSAYRYTNYQDERTYEIRFDGDIIGSTDVKLLTRGIYIMEADLFYSEQYMDTMAIVVTISENYDYGKLYYQGSTISPYMAQPLKAYGYSYLSGSEGIIEETQEKNIYTTGNSDYRYVKTVIDLDFATEDGVNYPDVSMPVDYDPYNPSKWFYPYSAAIILKNSEPGLDLRDASIDDEDFNGVGLYIRYDGYDFYTKVFLRINGDIYYTYDITSINWLSNERTIVEANFVEETGSLYIHIHNGNGSHTIRLGNGSSNIASGQSIYYDTLLPIITNVDSSAGMRVRNTKATIYQMQTGFKTISYNNYVNYDTAEFISNASGGVKFTEGDRIFIDNGSGLPMVSDFNRYSITFKAEDTMTAVGDEYFRLLIGTNKPTFDTPEQNKGIYLTYRKEVEGSALYFGFYKKTFNFRERKIFEDELSELIDNEEHTIDVLISRDALPFTSLGYVMGETAVYTAQIYVDGNLKGNGYIPVSNNLSIWFMQDGSLGPGSDISYDNRFLNSNLYPGFEVMTSEFTVMNFVAY